MRDPIRGSFFLFFLPSHDIPFARRKNGGVLDLFFYTLPRVVCINFYD